MSELVERKDVLTRELSVMEAPAPRLMPDLADLYRAKIATLCEALEDQDTAAVHEQIRGLIAEIRLTPDVHDPKRPLSVELRGELAAMLLLGMGYRTKKCGHTG